MEIWTLFSARPWYLAVLSSVWVFREVSRSCLVPQWIHVDSQFAEACSCVDNSGMAGFDGDDALRAVSFLSAGLTR